MYTLLSLMPSTYQQENLESMLGLFLQAQGYPLPQHSKSKSASALSRFLNIYDWSTLSVIRTTRNRIIWHLVKELTFKFSGARYKFPLNREICTSTTRVSACCSEL